MKFWEAMKALEEGKKVRGKGWAKDCYIYKDLDSDYLREENGIRWETFDVKHGFHEWEIYEESEPTFYFMEIVAGLKEGKKFRRKSWEPEAFLSCGNTKHVTGYHRPENQFGQLCALWIEDFEATDWVEVKE